LKRGVLLAVLVTIHQTKKRKPSSIFWNYNNVCFEVHKPY
jgi:hypothetical protein